jgi:hypothetical protein
MAIPINVLQIIMTILPGLIQLAETAFSWKQKSGQDKKNFVVTAVQSFLAIIQGVSTGGQKATWERYSPVISSAVDVLVEDIFPRNTLLDSVTKAGGNS